MPRAVLLLGDQRRSSSARCWRSLPPSPRRSELRPSTSPGCTCAGAAWSSWRPWRCLTALRHGCCRPRALEGPEFLPYQLPEQLVAAPAPLPALAAPATAAPGPP